MSDVSNSDSSWAYASFSLYNALGQPRQISFHNSTATTLSYDSLNRLNELTTTIQGGVPAQHYIYHYDENGNILGIDDHAHVNCDQGFTYDGLNRLTTATSPAYNVPGDTITIQPDAVGNIDYNADSSNPSNRNCIPELTYDYDNRITSITTGGVDHFFRLRQLGSAGKENHRRVHDYLCQQTL